MASLELSRLWKLHQVDSALVEIRKRAAALDPGKQLTAEIKVLEKEYAVVGGESKALLTEQLDLELAQKSIDDKLKKIDGELYGGKLVNPREIEAFEKEIVILKKQRSAHDDRLLELMELIPPAKAKAERIEKAITVRKKGLVEKHKEALQIKTELETRFATLNKDRPEVAKTISPEMMARYEAIRKRTPDGLAMTDLHGKQSCGACGTMLPERVIVSAAADRLTTCESCHRILYYTEGVV